MTTQVQKDDWDFDKEKIKARLERNRVCPICKESFRSAKRVRTHKEDVHSY